MEERNLHEVHWHDSLVLHVSLSPDKNTIEMRLLLPEFAREGGRSERTVVFTDAYGYKEIEGPLVGAPTILQASIVDRKSEWLLVKLETNAGHREVWCKHVQYKPSRSLGRASSTADA